jgi:hypothetical protein
VPWAFVLAIAIVIAFELFLRTRPAESMIAYPQVAAYEDQTVHYRAVRQSIDAFGTADVALVGSSQMREGVAMPRLIDNLHERLGLNITVANYATRGARADVMQAAVQYLLNQPKKPRLIIIGISVRDLRTQSIDWPRLAVFWDTNQWLAEFRTVGWRTTDVLPVVIRNETGKLSHSLRYRDQLAIDIAAPFGKLFGYAPANEGNPIAGESTWQHQGSRGLRDLVDPRISPKRMMINARASYAYEDGAKPSEPLTRRLQTLINQLDRAGVGAILVEMPVADYMENDLAARKLTAAFDRSVNSLVAGTSVRYLPTSAQPFKPTRAHFTDMQHFNRPGAELFSDWLADEIAKELR